MKRHSLTRDRRDTDEYKSTGELKRHIEMHRNLITKVTTKAT